VKPGVLLSDGDALILFLHGALDEKDALLWFAKHCAQSADRLERDSKVGLLKAHAQVSNNSCVAL